MPDAERSSKDEGEAPRGYGFVMDAAGHARDVGVEQAAAACFSAPLVWIHLDGRSDATRAFVEAQDVPEAARTALTAIETRPRVDLIHGGALLNLRGLPVDGAEAQDGLASIRLWIEKGRVLSVTFTRLAALRPIREAAERGAIRDPGDLITAIAVAITEALDPEVAALGDTLDECEAALDPSRGLAMRREIGKARARATLFRRFVAPQRQALERLAALEVDWLEEDDRTHVRAAADRFARMAEELEAVRERAALMHEQLTDLRAELIDQRTLLLSVVALVFLPLTFVTGLFGMNVGGIPLANAAHGFWLITILCLGLAGAVAAYFVRAHWFRG